MSPKDGRHSLHVRLPPGLASALEELRFMRSKELGRRISLRQLVEELLTVAVGDSREDSRV